MSVADHYLPSGGWNESKDSRIISLHSDWSLGLLFLPNILEIILKCLDPSGGIIEVLYSNRFLSHGDRQYLTKLVTKRDKNNYLLTMFMRSDDAGQSLFLKALTDTTQSHVANVIQCKGDRPEGCEEWPLTEDETSNTKRHYRQLIENLRLRREMLEELCKEGVITEIHKMDIIDTKKNSDKNRHMLDLLLECFSGRQYEKFKSIICKWQGELVGLLD